MMDKRAIWNCQQGFVGYKSWQMDQITFLGEMMGSVDQGKAVQAA